MTGYSNWELLGLAFELAGLLTALLLIVAAAVIVIFVAPTIVLWQVSPLLGAVWMLGALLLAARFVG